jgi:hypothetical protein
MTESTEQRLCVKFCEIVDKTTTEIYEIYVTIT